MCEACGADRFSRFAAICTNTLSCAFLRCLTDFAEYLRICRCDRHDTRHSARSTCRETNADEKVWWCTARSPAGDSERCLKRPSKGSFAAEKASVPSNLIEEP